MASLGSLALDPIDAALVVLYFVAIAAIGLWLSRGVKTGKDLFLGGRTLPWWAVGTSLVVSDIGAKDMVGLADDGYRYGMVMMNFDFIGCIFPVLVAAFLFMPYLWLAGVYTIPEYLGRRYNRTVRTLFAAIWGTSMVAMLATIFVSAGTMFEHLLGWNFYLSIGVLTLVVGVYTTLGGLKAVVFTDFVSCIVLIIGATLICVAGLVEVGGWSELQRRVAELPGTDHHFQLILPADAPRFSWPSVLLGLGFVAGPAYWIGNQAIVQRTLGTTSQSAARASYILCAAIKLVFPILLVVPGLIGLALFHDQVGPIHAADWQGGRVLPLLVQLLPRGVLGIVLGAFMAGVMSNLDSYVNSASTLWVKDIYVPLFRPQADEGEVLRVGRWLVVLFLAGGAAGSHFVRQYFGSVFEAFQTFLSLFQGALLALLLLGMLFRRINGAGGVAGIIVGVGLAFFLHGWKHLGPDHVEISYLWVAWWSFVAAAASTVAVSLVTKPYDQERLLGLVYSLPAAEKEPQ